METQITWNGDVARPLQICRPCPCGCDLRGGNKGVGYLTGSNDQGEGFTIWIQDEAVYQAIKPLVKELIWEESEGADNER